MCKFFTEKIRASGVRKDQFQILSFFSSWITRSKSPLLLYRLADLGQAINLSCPVFSLGEVTVTVLCGIRIT